MWIVLFSEAFARPTEAEQIERRVERALPDCAAVQVRADDPVPALLSLAERSPSLKVRERAASCLLERHAEQVEDAIAAWMHREDDALVSLVLSRLDSLPVPVAVGAASAGLRGPHAPLVEPAVAASAVPLVRAALIFDEVD